MNQGHGKARRKSLELCTNELVALMDSDDVSAANRFEVQLSLFQVNPKIDICGGNISEFIGNELNIVSKRIVPSNDAEIKKYAKSRCPMNQMTVMFKRSSYNSAGGYIDWYQDEDYFLWLRMIQKGFTFANSPDILVNVRVGEDMYARRGGWPYFKSERKLQKYMLDQRLIGFPRYLANCAKRFVVQVLLPTRIRGWVFKKLARDNL